MKTVDHLNNTVFCKLAPSPIHGIGVFAIRDIKKGQELTDYRFTSEKELFQLPVEEFDKILLPIRKLILDRIQFCDDKTVSFFSPNTDQVLQSFMNHSIDANSDGRFALVDIKTGDEVTENYHLLAPYRSKLNQANFFI